MPSRIHTSSASRAQSHSQSTNRSRRPIDISGFFPCAPLPSSPSLSHPICARVSRPFAPNLFPSCTAGCSSTPARNGAFSLHAAQIETTRRIPIPASPDRPCSNPGSVRSEEHTSELQSLAYLVCRLLLEKKKKINVHHLSRKKKKNKKQKKK